MGWLTQLKVTTRFNTGPIWSRYFFDLDELDGEDGSHAALVTLEAAYQPGHFIQKMLAWLDIQMKVSNVAATAYPRGSGTTFWAMPPAVPITGNWFAPTKLMHTTAKLRLGYGPNPSWHAHIRVPSGSHYLGERNEFSADWLAALEEFATDLITPRLLPTGQTICAAVRRSDGSHQRATRFSIWPRQGIRYPQQRQ